MKYWVIEKNMLTSKITLKTGTLKKCLRKVEIVNFKTMKFHPLMPKFFKDSRLYATTTEKHLIGQELDH